MLNFLESASVVFNNPLATSVLLLFLLGATYTDVKYLKIYNKFNLTLVITRIIFLFLPVYAVKFDLGNIVASISVFMLSEQLFGILHTSMYNITPTIFMTSYPISTLSLYRFHENTTTIPGISPAIFDITATVSVSSQGWHTHLYRRIALLMTSQQVCKSSHLAHVWHHTQSTSHHIHTIWHERSCFMTSDTRNSWHQIFSLWHHIHSLGHHTTLCMTSSPLSVHRSTASVLTSTASVSSHKTYWWHHSHYMEGITCRISVISYPLCFWQNIN